MEKEKLIKDVTAIQKWSSNLLNSLKGLQGHPDEDEAQALASLSQLILKRASSVNQAFEGNAEVERSGNEGSKEDSAKIKKLEKVIQEKVKEIQKLNQNLAMDKEMISHYQTDLNQLTREKEELFEEIRALKQKNTAVENRNRYEAKRSETQRRINDRDQILIRDLKRQLEELMYENAELKEKLDDRKPEA